ncbi:MAG: molybdenum cofactor guanylyltransferase [Planctomycetota bacterium JB042]
MSGAPTLGGVVLAGGRSTRMGRSKAHLPFGDETMLGRTVRLLGAAAAPIVVVGAPGQELPPLPGDVEVVRDAEEGRGPLAGIEAGLAALGDRCDAAFVCGCDTPLLRPEFVRRVAALLEGHDAAVPVVDDYLHPLGAVYRTTVLADVRALLADDRRRPAFLFERVPTRRIAAAELEEADPDLRSLRNLNRPEDVAAALAAAGLGEDDAG